MLIPLLDDAIAVGSPPVAGLAAPLLSMSGERSRINLYRAGGAVR
ncbi:hypothetical protein [Rugosimonospora acidiphila]